MRRVVSFALGATMFSACGASHSPHDSGIGDASVIASDAALDGGVRSTVDAGEPSTDILFQGGSLPGRAVWIRVVDRAIGVTSAWFTAPITADGFEVVIPGGMPRDRFGVMAEIFFDGGDGVCIDGDDPAYEMSVNNDFESDPIVANVPPEDFSGTASRAPNCSEIEHDLPAGYVCDGAALHVRASSHVAGPVTGGHSFVVNVTRAVGMDVHVFVVRVAHRLVFFCRRVFFSARLVLAFRLNGLGLRLRRALLRFIVCFAARDKSRCGTECNAHRDRTNRHLVSPLRLETSNARAVAGRDLRSVRVTAADTAEDAVPYTAEYGN